MGDGGFGPPKSVTTDLQSAPFGRSGIPPNYGAGSNFFDDYVDYLNELATENHEELTFDKYDTDENLWNWYNSFDSDPLPHFIETIRDRIEDRDYTVVENDNYYYFGKYSSWGQDFGFYIEKEGTIQEFIDKIYDYYNDYDVSEAAYIWLDEFGHGKNGAPYDMIDVYKDMEECESFIIDLYELLTEWHSEKY